jgi:hypothetical protein
MKKTLFLSAVIGMAALFVSCNGDDNNPVKLDVSTTTINVDAAQTTETFDITTTAKWNITAPDSWVSAAPANGNGNATITVTVQANEATTPRSTNIKVTAGDQVKEITINQAAAEEIEVFTCDDLLGTWNSAGFVLLDNNIYENGHTMEITKIDETTILISNMININEIFSADRTDEYLASVDIANMTITIKAGQECSPSIFIDTDKSVLVIDKDEEYYCNNAGVDFVISINIDEDGNITMEPNADRYFKKDDAQYTAGFTYIAYDTDGTCLGGGVNLCGLSWTKASPSEAVPFKTRTNKLTNIPAIEIGQNR